MASEPDDGQQPDEPAVGAGDPTDGASEGPVKRHGLGGETDGAQDGDEDEEAEDEDDEDEDDDDEEPQLKYARLTGSLGGLYRNGDATSAALVAGDKMIVGTHNGNIPSVPLTPSNSIHIATSSIDGNVCIASLVDPKDVLLRNFSRPVRAVALSPEFKTDRSYLSGGLAGKLLLTVGGRAGTSSNSTATGGAAASASGWLGSIGLGSNTGKDTVLHSGEGAISTIKWSRTGKYVVWINEQGIKIMRSNLRLDSADSESAWKRISHVDRPDGPGWEEMSGVWKGNAEWIDEKALESDEPLTEKAAQAQRWVYTPTNGMSRQPSPAKAVTSKAVEKLVIGWGGTIWIIHVSPGGPGVGKHVGERSVGSAAIVAILRTDCIISGLSLYTPTLLVVLAYITPDGDDQEPDSSTPTKPNIKGKTASSPQTETSPRGGIPHRQNALSPELRLIDLNTSEEVSADSLTVSRFERLSAPDYHLGVVPGASTGLSKPVARGALEGLSGGLWTAGLTATRLFTSAPGGQGSDGMTETGSSSRETGKASSAEVSQENSRRPRSRDGHLAAAGPGLKIYIHSPYDCVLATKRDLEDHLEWLLSKEKYEEAWTLIDCHPEAISSRADRPTGDSPPSTPKGRRTSVEDFFADDASTTTASAARVSDSAVEKEKRRIGERWLQQLVQSGDWRWAGSVAGKVLGTSGRWEHWAWEFIRAKKYDEIVPFLPTAALRPPLPPIIYGVFLGYYISRDRMRLKELLDGWPPELFDVSGVIAAIQEKLKSDDVREDTIEGGETGRDWRILTEGLAQLFLADSRPREALMCYIRLQDADTAMSLIGEYHLLDAVADDIPGLILLRVSKEQLRSAPRSELEEATADTINLLADEAQYGAVRPDVVVTQLNKKSYRLFLFFYLRALWKGTGSPGQTRHAERFETDGMMLVEEFGSLAVETFAEYDRALLMEFLKASQSYEFEKAYAVCEQRSYVPELVYLLSKTGQTKRALFLIIDRLADVSQAISFAKSQADPDLWNDLLEYSMDKPRFIRGLLEEVGTAIDPIQLVRRIPKGLEIEGLRDGLSRMIREYEIQHSISAGVARVLRGEVASGMDTLRTGQKKGIRFEVSRLPRPRAGDSSAVADSTTTDADEASGRCAGCGNPFTEEETEPLIGFVCTHVFHLACLLHYPPSTTLPSPVPDAATAEYGGGSYSGRSVGAKVTHARLIRSMSLSAPSAGAAKISDGCPVPVHRTDGGAL
ncbi:MAG: Vacuolar protein sorting-associated protein 41 [Thelocarpon impressellum]|nr:MAG: Vacuolar protein sorting-associated protein 41 [Thelocarpon impressellum]